MTSSLSITLIALGIIAALAFFTAAGFRGSGKVSDYAPNLSKYRNDDDLETKTLDRTLTVAVLIASLLTIMIPLYYLGDCLLYTSPSPRDMRRSRMPSSA